MHFGVQVPMLSQYGLKFKVLALAELPGFSMDLVSLDVLHVYHLGVARDIVASTLVLLLKTTLIPGNSAPCFKKINSYIWFLIIFDFFLEFHCIQLR